MNFPKVELIIWDCDGVLVDSELLSSQAFADIITELGGQITTLQVYQALKGGSIEKSLAFVHEHVAVPNDYDLEHDYRKRSFEMFEKNLRPVEGIHEALRQTISRRCIGSNGPKNKIIYNLNLTGLKSYFEDESIFSAHDIHVFKPKPDLFLKAAQTFSISPAHCVVVEDSGHGAEAAKRAGMRCFGYTAASDPAELEQHGAVLFDDMRDLPVLLNF